MRAVAHQGLDELLRPLTGILEHQELATPGPVVTRNR